MSKWWTFLSERFDPKSYVPMIVSFCMLNAVYMNPLLKFYPRPAVFAVLLALTFSFFFRMRLFDEIKDYDVDLKINPHRPLARGLLTLAQVKTAIFCLIVLELVLAGWLGLSTFFAYVIALGFSLLMYVEFFLSDFLRPRLTTYAVSHTFVSVLIALFIALGANQAPWDWISLPVIFLLLSNWCFFNLFEFARKTFARAEERPQVDSYSKIFTLPGAVMLSVSQAVLGVLLLYLGLRDLIPNALTPLWECLILLMLYTAACSWFMLTNNPNSIKFFRSFSGAYLIAQYVLFFFSLNRM